MRFDVPDDDAQLVDVALVIFLDRELESDFAYAPHTIRSHFNHVLVLVAPAGLDNDGDVRTLFQRKFSFMAVVVLHGPNVSPQHRPSFSALHTGGPRMP